MAIKQCLLLGNKELYEVSQEVHFKELPEFKQLIGDLHDTLIQFNEQYEACSAIAAPVIGVKKRIIYMNIDTAIVMINPVITLRSIEMKETWETCMSFPDLYVRVLRHNKCRVEYRDIHWGERYHDVEGKLSDLLQHSMDHLNGILSVSRAIDGQSFALRSQR
ncbi:MAG: formylmethionine deformylase [Candidatus Fischerbacteria bacterium RBG_13_37_8]|uniref:Peptide deformylase-like n=1 Tax=Candidatus Fischerbacteria bacterium RBG_13_37_8 TaxID=1817863 RepID=A0A1F5V4E7_9BACT|nr:MAG: formylmethionine deformylase [Candidatus Fischerbacteria bacterium RBG_13_37_8]